jgi:hypothetical protein
MPQINFNPTNQCTLDDPTDGAILPNTTPNVVPSAAPEGRHAEAGCQAREPGAGGSTSECKDELVRRFGGEGAGPTQSEPTGEAVTLEDAIRCMGPLLSTIGSCVSPQRSAPNCAGAVISLLDCMVAKH